MMTAMPCVCCKPVAEGGAGIGLRLLRGARKRNTIRYGDQEERRSSPVLPLMRGLCVYSFFDFFWALQRSAFPHATCR
jgi:hypothetical protein